MKKAPGALADKGNMNLRRYTCKLYPNQSQAEALDKQRRMHAQLYNGLVQQRIEAWSRQGVTLSYYDQCKELTALRHDHEIGAEWSALSSDSMAATAQRVDRAFKAFFRRARQGMGAQSGFPRFKRSDDYPGYSYKRHGSGYKIRWREHSPRPANGKLYLKGVPGQVTLRGRLPFVPEEIRTCDILRRTGAWWLSLVVAMPESARAKKSAQEGIIRFNLIDHFATVRVVDGGCAAGPEETVFAAADGRIISRNQGVCRTSDEATHDFGGDRRNYDDIQGIYTGKATPDLGGDRRDLQRQMSRCKRGSNKYYKLKLRKARIEARKARQRLEGLHRWTTGLANRFESLTIIFPKSISAETKSGHGNAKEWGAEIKLKAEINRHVLDQAPSMAVAMIEYKLEERGATFVLQEDDSPPVSAGNAIVASSKATRKLKRSAKNAQRFG